VYIDDEEPLCRIFQHLLRLEQFAVHTFVDPEEALAFVNANDVAVVVCDYKMPNLTGVDLLDRIDDDVPFYLITGDLQVKERARTWRRVTGVLSKPVDAHVLLEVVARHAR